MIQFVCGTCETKYPVEISGVKLIYMLDNRRIELKKEYQDCQNCENEIEQEVKQAEDAARKKMRERKNHDPKKDN